LLIDVLGDEPLRKSRIKTVTQSLTVRVSQCADAQRCCPYASIPLRAAGVGSTPVASANGMLTDALIRFAMGGIIVSAFSVVGELFKPKTFAGLFGAAPSVGIATLALTFHNDGGAVVATEARWMLLATFALVVYSATCVTLSRRGAVPVWLDAATAWIASFVVAAGLWVVLCDVVQT